MTDRFEIPSVAETSAVEYPIRRRIACPRSGRLVQFIVEADEFGARASIPNVAGEPPDDLRHTAITDDAAGGASAIALMAKAGHTNMATTKRYLHLAGALFREEVESLSGDCSEPLG